MAVLSVLGRSLLLTSTKSYSFSSAISFQVRCMGGHARTMRITPSRLQWHKFKDMVHLYVMVGAIPLSAFLFCVNVFIGPAKLREIPEGYTPNYWEYYRHPITRNWARYFGMNLQQEYEKFLHFIKEQDERRILKLAERRMEELMSERGDYKAWYYRPESTGRYKRWVRKESDWLAEYGGESGEN